MEVLQFNEHNVYELTEVPIHFRIGDRRPSWQDVWSNQWCSVGCLFKGWSSFACGVWSRDENRICDAFRWNYHQYFCRLWQISSQGCAGYWLWCQWQRFWWKYLRCASCHRATIRGYCDGRGQSPGSQNGWSHWSWNRTNWCWWSGYDVWFCL